MLLNFISVSISESGVCWSLGRFKLDVIFFSPLFFTSGGEGKTGRVVDIRGWDVETGRSVASVTWSDGTTNVYRVGHKGKVDLKCTVEASGGFYYKEHLPKLGVWVQIFC